MRSEISELWSRLNPDASGRVTAVVQHAKTGQVLMVGAMNEVALRATLDHRRVTFWSRSRDELWEKGASSGNTLTLHAIRADCDGDALLVSALPAGPTCHTGTTSCFFRRLGDAVSDAEQADDGPSAPSLHRVLAVIAERKAGRGMTHASGKSYVRALLDAGAPKIGAKVREEADEFARAVADEADARVASEAADLIFHALVGLASRDLDWSAVEAVFDARFGVSGIDEKRARPTPPPPGPSAV